ncbi:MAG: RsmD family RNA methyltransferase [Chitinophagaceae bacterium]|nr:RsmD family RNA methyltransferase [Chitinophagaceae bacterium]
MRIISGKLGGRRLHPPSRMPYTRPTTDYAKEGLFNILQNHFDWTAIRTLDLFGGTGNISFELFSRGVTDLTVVEKNPTMHAFIKKTALQFQIPNMRIIKMDVFSYLKQSTEQFDLIFAGPPYALPDNPRLPELIFEKKLLLPGGWFILEHTTGLHFRNSPFFLKERAYGTTLFSFFQESSDES